MKIQKNRLDTTTASRCPSRTLGMVFIVALVSQMVGCATTAPEPEVERVWPVPPATPVIRFETLYGNEDSVRGGVDWKSMLLGEADEPNKSLVSPYDVHIDQQGRALVADTNLPGLAVMDFAAKEMYLIGAEGPDRIAKAFGVDTADDGRIYVTDGVGRNVKVFDREGSFIRAFEPEQEFGRPIGIAINNSDDRVYVSDTLKHLIFVFDREGQELGVVGKGGYVPGTFNFPQALAVDRQGRLYVVDSMNFRVQIVDPATEGATVIGRHGDGPGEFARPRGVAVDSDGNVYVSDGAFSNIQIFDQEGKLLLFFGDGGPLPGSFSLPSGIHIDDQNRIWVADQLNRRIQLFEYLGKPGLEESIEPAQE